MKGVGEGGEGQRCSWGSTLSSTTFNRNGTTFTCTYINTKITFSYTFLYFKELSVPPHILLGGKGNRPYAKMVDILIFFCLHSN